MSSNVFHKIKTVYEKKQKLAFDSLMQRMDEIYAKIPRIHEIDTEIKLAGIKYNKMILLGNFQADNILGELTLTISRLKNEKEELLFKSGYSKNYLEMAYECSKCKDTGYVDMDGGGSSKCSCYKQLLIDHLFSISNLKLSDAENFSLFNEAYYPDVVNEKKYGIKKSPREHILGIKERCLKFINSFEQPEERNLFFSGPTGVGKTFMANCIAVELLNRGRTVLYQTASMLFENINEHKLKLLKDDDYEDNTYRNIFEVDLLIIDDLGTESFSSARYSELLNILNSRQSNNLNSPCKTIISTNVDLDKLYEYYDERVVSRIIGCFDMFKFAGEDIRSLKKLNKKGS